LRTAYISHPDCHNHDTGLVSPENEHRLTAIEERLRITMLFDFLRHIDAPEVTKEQLLRVHSNNHIAEVEAGIPDKAHSYLDPDTVVSPGSLKAAHRAAGAVVHAVDLVMSGEIDNAFCCVRPPGHHAENSRVMGFCLYNNIAVGAAHALTVYGLDRIAILDFDVHQGNGTEQIFMNDERVMFCSTFQHPFYPNTGLFEISDRMVSVPLEATARSAEFRVAVTDYWLPAIDRFKPEMVFISAGFDAHQDDDMSNVSLVDDDYRWVTEQIMQLASTHADGRIVSSLEGGYELLSLARSVELHLRTLMGLN